MADPHPLRCFYFEDAAISASKSAFWTMHASDGNPVWHLSVLEIRRAIAHHRRAIDALHNRESFQGIHSVTAERLAANLERDLRRLEDELGRRRLAHKADRFSTTPSAATYKRATA